MTNIEAMRARNAKWDEDCARAALVRLDCGGVPYAVEYEGAAIVIVERLHGVERTVWRHGVDDNDAGRWARFGERLADELNAKHEAHTEG